MNPLQISALILEGMTMIRDYPPPRPSIMLGDGSKACVFYAPSGMDIQGESWTGSPVSGWNLYFVILRPL